jgi:HSP20 family protein
MATITPWAPVGEAISLRDAIDRLLEQSVLQHRPAADRGGPQTAQQPLRLPVDVYETPRECVVRAWAPGLTADQLSIEWNQGVLSVRGTLPQAEPGEESVSWHTRELPRGRVAVDVPLPGQIDVDQAQATLDAGVLTLRIPKARAAQPKTIRVGAAQA